MPDKNRHPKPEKKVTENVSSAEHGKAVITDIESLIEPPSKPVRNTVNTAKIENAVRSANIPMILMIFIMVVFGLVILYSVSGPDAYGQFQNSAYFLNRQLAFTIGGLVFMLIAAFIPINFYKQNGSA